MLPPVTDRMRLAMEMLEYAMNDLLQDRAFTAGRQIAELTIIGLYFKILAGLESVITLVEKGLPTFALFREMLEALISMTYIATVDSLERADLYRDYLSVSRWKFAAERARNPELEGTVSGTELKNLEEAKELVVAKRGEQVVEEMQDPRKWRTWAGGISVRRMSQDAGLSETTYLLGYGWPSQAIHAQDADRYFEVLGDGIVRPARPSHPDSVLLPAASLVLVAMEVIDKFLGLGKIESIRGFKKRIETLTAKPGVAKE